jgi:hypothetical protein
MPDVGLIIRVIGEWRTEGQSVEELRHARAYFHSAYPNRTYPSLIGLRIAKEGAIYVQSV